MFSFLIRTIVLVLIPNTRPVDCCDMSSNWTVCNRLVVQSFLSRERAKMRKCELSSYGTTLGRCGGNKITIPEEATRTTSCSYKVLGEMFSDKKRAVDQQNNPCLNVSDRALVHHPDIGHPTTMANGMLYSHKSTTIEEILDKNSSQCIL